jgi:hypothetical protein
MIGCRNNATFIEYLHVIKQWKFKGSHIYYVDDKQDGMENDELNLQERYLLKLSRQNNYQEPSEHIKHIIEQCCLAICPNFIVC